VVESNSNCGTVIRGTEFKSERVMYSENGEMASGNEANVKDAAATKAAELILH